MIRQAPVKIINLPVELVLHLVFRTACERLVRNRIARIDIIVAQRMCQRPGIKVCGRFHTFNTNFTFVKVFLGMRVVIDHVVNIITISGYTPVHARR